jgi:hypothetical protein
MVLAGLDASIVGVAPTRAASRRPGASGGRRPRRRQSLPLRFQRIPTLALAGDPPRIGHNGRLPDLERSLLSPTRTRDRTPTRPHGPSCGRGEARSPRMRPESPQSPARPRGPGRRRGADRPPALRSNLTVIVSPRRVFRRPPPRAVPRGLRPRSGPGPWLPGARPDLSATLARSARACGAGSSTRQLRSSAQPAAETGWVALSSPPLPPKAS